MDAQKWDGILAQATEAFARFGFRKTSIEEIARAAGVAKGTIYNGCESKRDLFYQAILRDLRRWNGELARHIDPRIPADELIVEVGQAAFSSFDRYPLARDLILGLFDQDLPDWVEHLDQLRAAGLTTILEILNIGVRQGRFRQDLDLPAVAGVLLDMITAAISYHSRGPEASERFARHARALLDLALNGLLQNET